MKKTYFYVIGAAALWGTMGLFVRNLTGMGITQAQIVLLRVLVSSVTLLPVLLIKDKKLLKVRLKDLWCFVGTGIVSLTLFNLCYFTAMQYTTLSVAAVLLYTSPAFVMLLSAVLFRERLTISRLGALVLVFAGCVMVTGVIGSGAAGITLPGVLYGLGSGVAYALYSIFGRYALNRGYDSFTITFYTFVFSIIGCVPIADVGTLVTKMSPALILWAIGVGVITGVLPYLLYTKGLAEMDNGTASVLATLEPAVATLVGVIVFREAFGWYNLVGICLLFAGILVLSRSKDRETDGAPAAAAGKE